MSFLARWFEHPPASRPVAKERLKVVLAQERMRISPDTQRVSISFRGTREGLCITLGDGPWKELVGELAVQLDRRDADATWRGARVHLETGNRSVGSRELEEVSRLLARHAMSLSSVIGQVVSSKLPTSIQTRSVTPPPPPMPPPPEALGFDARTPIAKTPASPGRPVGAPKPTRPARAGSAPPPTSAESPAPLKSAGASIRYATKPVPAGELPDFKPRFAKAQAGITAPAIAAPVDRENPLQASQALLIRRTVRSGQVIHYAGTIVVFGDVNPAAEVIAEGDVIVLGKLRGVVYAGSAGDDNAVVGALILAPTQVRIGKQVARAPDEKRWHPWPAEIARIRSGQIVVEPWGVP